MRISVGDGRWARVKGEVAFVAGIGERDAVTAAMLPMSNMPTRRRSVTPRALECVNR